MSLEDIRSECSDTAALLQPYVDGELATPELERVAEHVTACRACRAAVAEQQWVRAALRATEREQAPAVLRGRILAALDEVEIDDAADSMAATAIAPIAGRRVPARASMWSRTWSSFGDIARGALVMVPAGAVAIGLFFVARDGMVPVPQMPSQIGAALTTHEQEPTGATAPKVARPGESLPPVSSGIGRGQLQLVGAQLPEFPEATGALLRYEILRDGQRTGRHVVDHQLPLGGPAPTGNQIDLNGRRFVVDTSPLGEPTIYFESRGLSHSFVLEGGSHHDDIFVLLELAEQQLIAPVAANP